jgi:predicted nucleic acid-binding protein
VGVILDTSIWVDVERGRLSPADVAAVTGDEPVYLTPPVLAELEYGVQRAATPAQRNRRASALARIRRNPCLTVDADTGAMFGRLAADLDASGQPHRARVQDLWIAALGVQHGLKVLTQNVKDFSGIPGLQVLKMPRAEP